MDKINYDVLIPARDEEENIKIDQTNISSLDTLALIENVETEKNDTNHQDTTSLSNSINSDENTESNNVLKIETEKIENTPISIHDSLEEFDLSVKDNNLETITLRKPNEIYHDMFVNARNKARSARKTAMLAYLEAKNIKSNYMLDDEYSSDEEYERQIKHNPEQLLLEG